MKKTRTNFCSGFCDRTKIVDHVGLGHTNTSVADSKKLVLLVGHNSNVQFLLSIKNRGFRQRRISYFVESIGTVRDDFSEEDLLVRVESV